MAVPLLGALFNRIRPGLRFDVIDTPVDPPPGTIYVYNKAGHLTQVEEDGTETDLASATGGGAPASAPFVTTAADAGLSAEKVLGTDVIMSGVVGARPAFGTAGRLYWATDENIMYRDTAAAWVKVGTLDLADMTEKLHASLSTVTADQHHAQSHAHSGADGSGTVAHSATTGITATDHHSNANDPSSGEKAALAGTSGTPGSGNKYVTDGDARNTNARTPSSHASTHQNSGGDEIATATPAANAIPKAGAGGKLTNTWVPDFVASGASHASGGVPDPGASSGTTKFLREDAGWQVPAGSYHFMHIQITNGAAAGSALTINVNSTGYIVLPNWAFNIDLDVFPFTHFRIIISGNSNAVGQTITAQLATVGAPTTPIHSGGDDVVVTNTPGVFDSGWRTRDDGATGLKEYLVAVKGSNTTVDITQNYVEVLLKL